jgi:hypothetical protein
MKLFLVFNRTGGSDDYYTDCFAFVREKEREKKERGEGTDGKKRGKDSDDDNND